MPDFEEAKKRWLAKVGNKSWTQLAHEREVEIDAKVANLMTPEYVDSWGKVDADEENNQA